MNALLSFAWPFSETVVERLGWVLVHSLWQFTLVALLAGTIVRAIRQSSSATRYGVLVVAMAVLIVVPLVTWLISPSDVRDELASRVRRGGLAPGQDSPATTSPGADATRLASNFDRPDKADERGLSPQHDRLAGDLSPPVQGSSFNSAATGGLSPPATQGRQEMPSLWERAKAALRPWLVWIVVGWSFGVGVCSLRPLLGWHTLRRLKRVGVSPVSDDVLATLRRVAERLGLRLAVRVLQSTLAQVPVVVGYFRPVILLPVSLMTSLSAEQLEAILAHELAHVRRHDFVVNLLQTLVETFFFYHPAVWWLSRQIRVEREHCCDDLVVASLGNRVEYGRALLAIEELRGHGTVLALGAADGSLLSRIRRIAGFGTERVPNEHSSPASIGLILFGVLCALSMTCFAMRSGSKPGTQSDPLTVTTPDGLTVELLGVANYLDLFPAGKSSPSVVPKPWWRPDGERLEQWPLTRFSFPQPLPEAEKKHKQDWSSVAVRIRGPKAEEVNDTWVVIDGAQQSTAASSGDNSETSFVHESLANAGPLPGIKSGIVRVAVGAGEQGPWQRVRPNEIKEADAPIPEELVAAYEHMADVRFREVNGQTRLVTAPYDVSKVRASTEMELVDVDGQRVDGAVFAAVDGEYGWTYPIPLARVAHYRFRLRAFRHWITFENVSFQPGHKTEVKSSVGKTPELRRNPFIATLPNGVSVEFVGLAAMGMEEENWRKPDGVALSPIPILAPTHRGKWQIGTEELRRTLFHVRGLKDRTAINTNMSGTNADEQLPSGEQIVSWSGALQKPHANKPVVVRIGVTTEPLSPTRILDANGQRRPLPADAPLDHIAEDIKVTKVRPLEGGHKQVNGKFVPISQTEITFEMPAAWRQVDLRIVAIDKTSQTHHQSGVGGNLRGDANSKTPGTATGIVIFPLPPEQIERFEYQFRLYRHWAIFENVAWQLGEMTDMKVTTDSIAKVKRTSAEIAASEAELQRLRAKGQAALERGDYQAMAKAYETLSRGADGSFRDALWLGHARHLMGRWSEARDAYQWAIAIADRRVLELEQQTGPIEEVTDPHDEGRKFGGPVRDWQRERNGELEQLRAEWPQLVLLAGQVELMQLGDAVAAVNTLSRGMRFTPEAESMERLLEDAQKVAGKQQSPPHPKWSEWMYPMATQRSLAQAFEKLGDDEAAARCWSRIQLSFLAYQVGMAFVDADHLVEIVSRVPADKRQPFHEFVLKNPGRETHKRVPYSYQARLGEDKRNPFRVAAKLDAFDMARLGPAHANMVKLPNGRWLLAYTSGDAFQTRLYLSSSADGTTWDAPWEFAHNNIFPAHSPALVLDDEGTIWMLCTSQRLDINRYSSGGFRLWLSSSRDGREWSPLRPINTPSGFQFQYQNSVQLTRDRRGTFWVFGGGQFASAKTPGELRALQPLRLPFPDKVWASELHATFDANNRCHLAFVSGHDAIYRTSSIDMQNWTPPEKLAERREGSRVTAPQLLVDGDRIALIYETFSGHLRRGQFHGGQVAWSNSIPIGLPLGGSALARDGDRVLLMSGEISVTAAPVLLEARISDLLTPVAADQPSAQPASLRQPEWGPEHHGLKTRLTLASERTAVGQPLQLRCELQNVGTVVRTINPQDWNGYRGFVVVGPDGKECELIARAFPVSARKVEIKPGETRTLFDRDIAPDFLIQSAGEHTLRLHGGPQSKVGDIDDGQTPIPPPNDVVVTLAAGEVTQRQLLFLKLRTLAPVNWRSTQTGSSFFFTSDRESDLQGTPSKEAAAVHLWFSDTEYVEANKNDRTANQPVPVPPVQFGETGFGFGYLWANDRALRDWPKCVEQIRDLLPETNRAERINKALDQPVTLKINDTKWSNVIADIAKQHRIPIIVDVEALNDLNVSQDKPISLTVKEVTLREALGQLLEQVGGKALGFVVEDEVVKITAAAKLAERLGQNDSGQGVPSSRGVPAGVDSNALRCRLFVVPATASDESPDITKTANGFARGEDVAFAVELQNVSDRLRTLIGVRHDAKGQPRFEGKLAPELFAPHLFEFEFTDATGNPVPRTSRGFLEMPHVLDGALTHELAPGKSLVVLLRPAQFHSPMDHRLPPGTYRAKVRYHGPSDSELAYFRAHRSNELRAKAWFGDAISNEVTFKVANDPSVPSPPPLVWGPVKDGLQAAVEFRPLPGAAPTNDPPGTFPTKPDVSTIFHVKNVSDRTIKFVSETGRQGDEVTATNEAGESKRLEGGWFTGIPIMVRWTLKPGEVAELHALTAGIGLIKKQGKYTLRYSLNFRSLVRNKGEGDDGFPKPDDYQQTLVTGDTPVTIRARPPVVIPVSANGEIRGVLLDAETGEPIERAQVACEAFNNHSGKRIGSSTYTDDEGRYRLHVPSPGIYNVWLHEYHNQWMTAVADDGLFVEAGKVTSSEMFLVNARKIVGTLVWAGKPVEYNVVKCNSPARPESLHVQKMRTKSDGSFWFAVPPGRAYLYVDEESQQTKDNEAGGFRSARAHIEVPADGDAAPVMLDLQKSSTKLSDAEWLKRSTPGTQIVRHEANQNVTGTVVDVTGKPITGAKVFRNDESIISTDNKGGFRVEALEGNQLAIHAVAPGYHVWSGTPKVGDVLKIVLEQKQRPRMGVAPVKAAQTPTEVAPNSQSNVGTLQPIKGEVIDAVTGKPIEGATVRFRFGKLQDGLRSKALAELVFRDVGRFTFELPDAVKGQTDLFVERTAEHPDYQTSGPGAVPLHLLFNKNPNHAHDFIRKVELVPGKIVTGQVLDLNGRPAKGIEVFSGRNRQGWQNGNAHRTTTDANGRYRLAVPNSERGRVYVIPNHAAAVSRAITPEFGEQPVFQLLRGTRFFGRMTDAQGRGVANVVVRADGGERVPWRYAMTDADGKYSLPPCQYGTYTVELMDEGWMPDTTKRGVRLSDVFVTQKIELPKTASTERQLDFKPVSSVRVTARYTTSDGQPLSGRTLTLHGIANGVAWHHSFREIVDQPGHYELQVPRGSEGRIHQDVEGNHFLRIVGEAADSATISQWHMTKFDKDGFSYHVRQWKAGSVTLRATHNGQPVKVAGSLATPQFADPDAARAVGARTPSHQFRHPTPGELWFDAHPDIDLLLKLEVPGFKPWQDTVRIAEGEDRVIDVPLESSKTPDANAKTDSPPAKVQQAQKTLAEMAAQNDEVFARKVSLNAKKMPLREALVTLAREARFPLRLDEPALAAAELDLDEPVTVTIKDEPLHAALMTLIHWDATQGVIRELRGGALFFTTIAAMQARTEQALPDWLKPVYNRGLLATLDDDNQVISISAGDALTDELLAQCKTLPRLRELDLQSRKITAAGLVHLAELTGLEKLTLYNINNADEGLGDFAVQRIVGLKSLRELHLNSCGTSDAGIRLLEEMPQLTLLDVYSEGLLTDAAIASIAKLKRLRSLSLNSYVGTERGWMRFSKAATRALAGLQELEHLHLVGQSISPETLQFPHLKSLSLGTADTNDACAARIAECLQLQSLELVYTDITDDGLKKISALPELSRLTLNSYKITDAGIEPLKTLKKLDHLSLRASLLTDKSLEHIAESKSLTRLDLNGSGHPGFAVPDDVPTAKFTVPGLVKLKSLPNLRTLWLTNFPSQGGYGALKELTQLRELTFMMVGLTDTDLAVLDEALPNTRINSATGGGGYFSPPKRKPRAAR